MPTLSKLLARHSTSRIRRLFGSHEVVTLHACLACGIRKLHLGLVVSSSYLSNDVGLLKHLELRVVALVDMQVLPVFGRVTAERVVQILPLSQVSLHLIVFLLRSFLVIIKEEVTVVAVKVV